MKDRIKKIIYISPWPFSASVSVISLIGMRQEAENVEIGALFPFGYVFWITL